MIFRTPKYKRYGFIRQQGDIRDFKFSAPSDITLPEKVDLRPQMPACYDQGQLGSCTAQGIAACIQYDHNKQNEGDLMPSRLFIYYNERKLEGTVNSDSGAAIRDGIKVVNSQGVCPESIWPYIISKFTKKPSCKSYKNALLDKALQYQAVGQTLNEIKSALASGFPVVFGFTVYESFESQTVATTGVVPMPKDGESTLGGHCTVIVGYDNSTSEFIVRNSWGSAWGILGHCYMPFEYILNSQLSSDFWVIQKIGK